MFYIVVPECHGNDGWLGSKCVIGDTNYKTLLKMIPGKDFEWDSLIWTASLGDNRPRICGDRKDPNYYLYIYNPDEYRWEKNTEPNIVIEYSKDGKAVGDFEVESFVDDVISNIGKGKDYIVSSSIAINALRLAIVEGKINKDDIKFLFYGKCGWKEVKVTKYGSITSWPKGFCDKDIDIAEKIITNAITMKKKEK